MIQHRRVQYFLQFYSELWIIPECESSVRNRFWKERRSENDKSSPPLQETRRECAAPVGSGRELFQAAHVSWLSIFTPALSLQIGAIIFIVMFHTAYTFWSAHWRSYTEFFFTMNSLSRWRSSIYCSPSIIKWSLISPFLQWSTVVHLRPSTDMSIYWTRPRCSDRWWAPFSKLFRFLVFDLNQYCINQYWFQATLGLIVGFTIRSLLIFHISQVEFECARGFRPIGGSPIRSCGPDGSWSAPPPHCARVDCGEIDWFNHLIFSPQKLN